MHNYADTDIYHLFQSIFTKDWEVGRERLSFIKKLTFLAQACRLSISFQIEIIAITFCHFFFWFISLIRVCSFAPKSSFFINCFLERAVVHEVCLAVVFQTQRPAILSHPLSIS